MGDKQYCGRCGFDTETLRIKNNNFCGCGWIKNYKD